MRIEAITSNITNEIRKVDSARRNDKVKAKAPAKSDSLSFSKGAQALSDTKANTEVVTAQVNQMPDIRTDRVNDVKQKIESGYYNSEEFTDKLAEKLMSDFGISES